MQSKSELSQHNVADLPALAWSCERSNAYGSVPGLDADELADPDELERQAMLQEWGPILALPVKHEPRGIRPAIDEDGHVDWGAFGTVDFSRIRPDFDKARYKADKLREELRNVLIMFSIVKERLPGLAKYLVLKYLRMGVIDEEDIANWDMWELAKLDERARQLRQQIVELREVSRTRQERQAEALLA
jgi:hypothetical protein